jgi:hypothetical protein
MLQDMIIRRIMAARWAELTNIFIKLPYKQLHNLYNSPGVTK